MTAARSEAPLLSIIVPVHNGGSVLPRSLAALAASDLPREFWELIVVDDASDDNTVELAAGFADTIARLGYRPHGPSYARNRGAEIARGEVLVFLDADVSVHPETLRQFAWLFTDDPTIDAAFGSYDDRPAAPGLVSQYRNLFHHYVHQQNRGEAETFWAGCGAVKRQVFLDVGMYNEWHFSRPQIEDIELGHRLRDRGYRIVLRPEIQATHLKRWTFRNMVSTDLKDRGVPWTRLLIKREIAAEARSLNLRMQERVCTAAVWVALLLATVGLILRDWRWAAAAGAVVAGVLVANVLLYRFFLRVRGILFAIAVVPLHLVYYILNGVSVVVAFVLHQTIGDPKPPASVQAFSERGVVLWPPVPKPMTGPENLGGAGSDAEPAMRPSVRGRDSR